MIAWDCIGTDVVVIDAVIKCYTTLWCKTDGSAKQFVACVNRVYPVLAGGKIFCTAYYSANPQTYYI